MIISHSKISERRLVEVGHRINNHVCIYLMQENREGRMEVNGAQIYFL